MKEVWLLSDSVKLELSVGHHCGEASVIISVKMISVFCEMGVASVTDPLLTALNNLSLTRINASYHLLELENELRLSSYYKTTQACVGVRPEPWTGPEVQL